MYNAVVNRVFEYFGFVKGRNGVKLPSKEYLLPERITIKWDDGTSQSKNIWGAQVKISDSVIKVVACDLSDSEEFLEHILIYQMDGLTIYAMTLEKGSELDTKAYFAMESKDTKNTTWLELSNLMLAKFLVGIEQLDEMVITYNKFSDYQDLYRKLVGFIDHEQDKVSDKKEHS